MANENIKLTSGEGDMRQRLDKRLRNSGEGAKPDLTVKHGEGSRRTYHNIHNSPSQGGSKGPMNNKMKEGEKR